MSSVTIGFTGDFCPINRVEQLHSEGNWQTIFDGVKTYFDGNDFNIIDLECPLTDKGKKIIKTGPHLRAKPESVEMLAYLNCNLVATANNHFFDYGAEGISDTYDSLKGQNIGWLGSGFNIDEAFKTTFIEKNGVRIGVINIAESEWTTTQGKEPGCAPIDYHRALLSIKAAKESGAMFVLVIVHGGHEHYPLPSPRMKSQSRYMIDAGADAVVGHHPHVISGYEVYKGKPIYYSLGNFCFDWPGFRQSNWNKGMLLKLSFSSEGEIAHEYELVSQNDEEPVIEFLKGDAKIELEKQLEDLNQIIGDDDLLETKFLEHCEKLAPIMLSRIQPYRNRLTIALHKRGLLPDIMGASKRRMLHVLAQCESHREVLLAVLKKNLD